MNGNTLHKIAMAAAALFLGLSISAQNRMVKGMVSDAAGEPLFGVGVIVDGTTRGAVTDDKGHFEIKVSDTERLVFSCIGFNTITVPVKGKSVLDITLTEDDKLLDEAVVIGYGTMKRSDLTGSVSSVGAKDIADYKSGTVLEAMGGKVAGVLVTSTDGTPGAGFDIKIRGVGTVNGDASPLYIVDGYETSGIDFLANQDIKSIEILKDASASAIYGSRAANGVVLVTTKSGRESRPQVSYNGSASYSTLSGKMDLMSPYEFVKLQMELNPTRYESRYFASGNDKEGNPWKYQSMEDYKDVKGIDWQDEVFHPTWSQNHDISVSGGSKTNHYFASFSHYDNQGIFVGSSYNKNSARVKIFQKLYDWLSFNGSVNYTSTVQTGIGTGGGTLSSVLQGRPTGGLFVTDYELRHNAVDPIYEQLGLAYSNYFNPLINAETVEQTNRADQWMANAGLVVVPERHLTFRTSFGWNQTFRRRDVFYGEGSSQAARTSGPNGNSRTQKNLRWSVSNTLNYKNAFAKVHKLDLMLGHETSFNMDEFLEGEAYDFPPGEFGPDNLGLGAQPSRVNSYRADKRKLSFFGRAFYSFADRYMLTATLRADASTVFADENKWGFFPSFAAAWVISKEKWMWNARAIDNLKLRAGWGTVGNDRISSYLSLDMLASAMYGQGGKQVTVFYPKQLPNQKLKWEGSTTTNLGLDLSMFKSRLSLTADAFIKDSKDLLLAQSLSLVTGFDSQWQNVGKIRNKGIELTINSLNVNRRHFSWSTDFNISFIRNELLSLADGSDYLLSRSGFNSNFSSYDYIAMVGGAIGSMYGYVFDGVYQMSDFNLGPDGSLSLKDGVVDISDHAGTPVTPGFIKYKDIDGDGVITPEDRTVIGNGQPDWYGGLTNTFHLYNFDLSFMLQFSVGAEVYNAQRMWNTQSKLENVNFLAEVTDRWTLTNASNKVPSATGYVSYDVCSRFIEDGSFLRLKNITLGYTLPQRISRKAFVSHLRLYLTAQNLWCLTAYKGFDPEVSMRSSTLMPAFDFGSYPKAHVFTAGVEIKF